MSAAAPLFDEPPPPVGARALVRSRPVAAVLIAAFVVGLVLRVYHLDRAPRPLQTADEYAWTWAGMSLLTDGVPRSWSYLSAYDGGVALRFMGQPFVIVSPWLDHPPLFALVAGAWARLGGYHDPYVVGLRWMRTLPLVLWVLTFVLLVLVLARMFDGATVAATMLVFAVAPPMVLHSKLVISENLLVPLFLGGWLLVVRFGETRSRAALAALFACALALPLIKTPALALSLALLLVAGARRQWPLVAAIAAGSALGLALHLGYGAHYGWSAFQRVQQAHAGRFVGFNSGLTMLFGTKIVDEWVTWPLWFIGLFGIVVDAGRDRGRDLYLQALVYAGCMTFFADQRSVYGWYWIPLYPAFAAGAGSFFVSMWRSRTIVHHAIWAVVAVPWIFSMGMEMSWESRQRLRAAFAALMAAVLAALVVSPRRRAVAARALCVVFAGLELAGDLLYVVRR